MYECKKEKLAKIEFTTKELRKLNPVHSGFLASTCLAVNDIIVVQKVLLQALNTRNLHGKIKDETLQEIAFTQTNILERILAANLYEYMDMVGKYVKSCEKKKDTSMQVFLDEASKVISNLKDASAYSLVKWYRDKATNHYDSAGLTSLLQGRKLGDDDPVYFIYLHEKDGNSNYILGEQVLLMKLSEESDSPFDQMEEFGDWVNNASRKIMKLHSCFFIQLLENHFQEKYPQGFSVMAEPHLFGKIEETCLPILWDFQSQGVDNER